MKETEYNVWIILSPARDLPRQWVGHCLDFDVVSHGSSFEHALSMTAEACMMVIGEDLLAGHDPRSRRAPEEFFAKLTQIQTHGERIPLDLALRDTSGRRSYALACTFVASKTARKAKKLQRPDRTADVALAQLHC